MVDGAHGSQLAGTKPSVQMDIKPDTASVTILARLTVGVNEAEVEARGEIAMSVKTGAEDVTIDL